MTTPPKSTRVAPAKVQAIRPAPKTIEPLEGWVLNSAFGFMRFDNTPAGVLVRLADVVRWLESSQSLPREKALETLCNALTPEAMQWLYWVDKTQYAKPVPADYMWGCMTAAQIEAQKYSQRQAALQRAHEDAQMSWGEFRGSQSAHIQAGKISFSKPDPTEPGLPAFLKAIRACWSRPKFNQAATVNILEDTRPPHLAAAAMRLDKAFELWGYGRIPAAVAVLEVDSISAPKTWAELVSYRKNHPGSGWTDSMRQILATREESRKQNPLAKGVRSAMAGELGIATARVGQLIREIKDPPKRRKTGTF